jgi:hypothetical protein
VLGHRRSLARSRDGAPVLQATCSTPPTLSPCGCPRCHCSPGAISPPTSSPSTCLRYPHAAPRAQSTRPVATIRASRLRVPRCSGRAYLRSMAHGRDPSSAASSSARER